MSPRSSHDPIDPIAVDPIAEPRMGQLVRFDGIFRGLKAAAVIAVLAIALWPMAYARSDPWLWVVPLAAATWYGGKWLLALLSYGMYTSRSVQDPIPLIESVALTAVLAYLALVYQVVPLALSLLYVWPLHRCGQQQTRALRYGIPVLVFGVLGILHLAAPGSPPQDAIFRVKEALLAIVWIGILMLALHYLSTKVQYLEDRVRIFTPVAWDRPYEQVLESAANTALEHTGADIVVLHAWDSGQPAATPPILAYRRGIRPLSVTRPSITASRNAIELYRDAASERIELRRRGHRAFYFQYDRPSRNERVFGGLTGDGNGPSFVTDEGITSSVAIVLAPHDTEGDNVLGLLWLYFRHATPFGTDKRREIDRMATALAGELAGAKLQLALLAQHENEVRDRVIGELHDDVKGDLSLASMELELFTRQSRTGANVDERGSESPLPTETLNRLDFALDLIQDALVSLSLIRAGSAMSSTSSLTLEAHLEKAWSIERPLGDGPKPGIHFVGWDNSIVLPNHPKEVEQVYRILAHAVRNSVKHSKGTEIRVTLGTTIGSGAIEILVEDDGDGFDTERVRTESDGLTIMKKRASSIGGELSVVSEPRTGPGTRVVFRMSQGESNGRSG
jgi:signal transduction histidine kinase